MENKELMQRKKCLCERLKVYAIKDYVDLSGPMQRRKSLCDQIRDYAIKEDIMRLPKALYKDT